VAFSSGRDRFSFKAFVGYLPQFLERRIKVVLKIGKLNS